MLSFLEYTWDFGLVGLCCVRVFNNESGLEVVRMASMNLMAPPQVTKTPYCASRDSISVL